MVKGTEENANIVEDAAIYFLQLFLNVKIITLAHLTNIRNLIGPITNQQANKIFESIKDIQHYAHDEFEEYFSTINDKCNSTATKRWGNHIVCQLPNEQPVDTSLLQDFTVDTLSNNNVIDKFSMEYLKPTTSSKASANGGAAEKYNRLWLLKHVNNDLIDSLIRMLQSKKSNTELQNELIEMLGFDKFEVVQSILENREQIVRKIDAEDKRAKLMTKTLSQHENRPTIASQVIVQSEHERNIKKQVRKDEKRLRNILQQNDNGGGVGGDACSDDYNDEELLLTKLRLNQQQSLLTSAKRQPLFKDRARIMQQPRIKYPYVFDSEADAKSHVGFIAGSKLMLPETVQRSDNKMYEEVKIPAQAAALSLPGISDVRVNVTTLDDIGQIAFSGTKQLNRIQSIVYPVAYHSNENLLVCAPTGAGKTNVAMLTIVHAIRSHTDQGVIHRDQFKIVYVAPMKALASEMVENFGKRLKPLGISVRELTGDMQLTRAEMQQTQMVVTTPEKWDVVTRKGAGDAAFISLVKLLIIDEVHLLHGDRGPVVEALVARTLRLVESSQSMIRIVGLSATLPNYIDVARFLRVNPMVGLFFFDARFRPVPLAQHFVGVKSTKPLQQLSDMTTICYDKCLEMLRDGHQVMIFVHARNATIRTATVLKEMAQQKQQLAMFMPEQAADYGRAQSQMAKSRNKQMVELFQCGFGVHHAGMLRTDRSLIEKYFSEGFIKVLVCTATLAWGVNLPAHAVIILGTEIYNAKQGNFL